MIVRPFADTNLAVYCLDADPTRRAKALSVMRARPVISVQVVNEFLSVVIRKGRLLIHGRGGVWSGGLFRHAAGVVQSAGHRTGAYNGVGNRTVSRRGDRCPELPPSGAGITSHFSDYGARWGGSLFMSAGFIASDWLKVQTLPLSEVQFAVQLMAVGVALRWRCGLYRGAISGSERFVWLGGYNSLIATLRFVGVLPVLMFVGNTPTVFFTYQLLVAVIDLAGLIAKTYRLLPPVPAGQRLG